MTKLKNILCATAVILGGLLILGTAGSLDLDRITFTQSLIQVGIGFLVCLVGYIPFMKGGEQ